MSKQSVMIAAHERRTGPETSVAVAAHERLIDPDRTVKAAAAAWHSPESYARSVVKRWPALSEEKRAEIRAILAPVVTSEKAA